MVEQIIRSYEELYLCEALERRTEMIEYDSGPNEELINLELKLIKIVNKYLREIKFNDLEKNKSILKAFSECFLKINNRY